MSQVRFDHFNLAVNSEAEANEYVRFFTEALGLSIGPRPPFNFDGYWLYAGDTAIVHLSILPTMLDGQYEAGAPANTGVVDHLAFWTENYDAFSNRLRCGGWPYRERMLPGRKMCQLFVDLPRGLVVEIDISAG